MGVGTLQKHVATHIVAIKQVVAILPAGLQMVLALTVKFVTSSMVTVEQNIPVGHPMLANIRR